MTFSVDSARKDLDAGLDALRERYPRDWERVSEELLGKLSKGRHADTAKWLEALKVDARQWQVRLAQSGQNPKVFEAAFPHLLRYRLARLALQKTAGALAAQQTSGTVRLGFWSGALLQLLLFRKGLERKPASLAAARRWWPFIKDRELLMALVQPKGIYCFYTRELVAELVRLIDGRPCVEIAAGDGTLARFVTAAGAPVTATDDGSWSHAVTYPGSVERLDAKRALAQYAPKVVLCSWPPPGNSFERLVFETSSVDLYVVIGSRHRFAAGAFDAWEKQRAFEWQLDERLSALVLPPELDPAVYVFRRKA